MMRTLALALLAVVAFAFGGPAWASHASRIIDIANIKSVHLPPQHVRVWLPPGYDRDSRRYGVVYLQDGQWAFGTDGGGHQTFAIDESIGRLAGAGRIEPVIVVAVVNPGEDRFRQFIPEWIYKATTGDLRARMDRELAGRPVTSAAFLKFLTLELKPSIDRAYRTLEDPAHTTMIGASMGGLIAAAAFVEYPEVFGRAAFISPQWPLYDQDMIDFPQMLSAWPEYFERLGAPAGRRVWLDHGTTMMDKGLGPYQLAITAQLERLGWKRGINLEGREHQGGAHDFKDWALHMDEMLAWLLK